MTSLAILVEGFSRWLHCVAAFLIAVKSRFAPARLVRLVESDTGDFSIEAHAGSTASVSHRQTLKIVDGGIVGTVSEQVRAMFDGSRVELVLRPGRFLFRQLELPERASEFLGGVVRSQIDRLTPWSADDAAFGWTKPTKTGVDRILVTVVATAQALVQPFFSALAGFGASSIVIVTVPANAGENTGQIQIFEQTAKGALDVTRIRRLLAVILLVAALAAAISAVGASVIDNQLVAEQDRIVRAIAARRAALRDTGTVTTGATAALQGLEQRKNSEPSRVIVLEELSKVLPDHTYVTEIRTEGNRLKVIGLTKDAPALIQLIEQSDYLSRATFFAPTTRGVNDPGERFHIEAQIVRRDATIR